MVETVRVVEIRPTPEFTWIDPQAVGDVWDQVAEGLEKIHRHDQHWRLEDVYVALKTGAAHLHLASVNGEYAGFVIAQPQQAPDGPVLHLWALYAESGNRDHFIDWLGQIDEWARSVKAKRITFHSPRKGWEKLGQKLGFEPTMTVFERKPT